MPRFFLIVPGIEGSFGSADGSGDGQVHVDRMGPVRSERL
jgi:hypothetical protein